MSLSSGRIIHMQEEVLSHLQMIEVNHEVKINNKESVAGWIAGYSDDHLKLLTIALSLNHWIAVNGKKGDIEVPKEVIERIISAVHEKETFRY